VTLVLGFKLADGADDSQLGQASQLIRNWLGDAFPADKLIVTQNLTSEWDGTRQLTITIEFKYPSLYQVVKELLQYYGLSILDLNVILSQKPTPKGTTVKDPTRFLQARGDCTFEMKRTFLRIADEALKNEGGIGELAFFLKGMRDATLNLEFDDYSEMWSSLVAVQNPVYTQVDWELLRSMWDAPICEHFARTYPEPLKALYKGFVGTVASLQSLQFAIGQDCLFDLKAENFDIFYLFPSAEDVSNYATQLAAAAAAATAAAAEAVPLGSGEEEADMGGLFG